MRAGARAMDRSDDLPVNADMFWDHRCGESTKRAGQAVRPGPHRPPGDIQRAGHPRYHQRFDRLHASLHRWDVWAATYLIGGTCSDDAFIDFRAGIIAQGHGWYEKVAASPDNLADHPAVVGNTDSRLPYLICSPTAALFQRAQGLGERPLQPGEVVGLAVMVRRGLVGPADRRVPYVFTGTLDKRSDIADAFGVGHRPVAAAGDVDRRGVRENPAAPFIEVVIDAERSAGYPRVPVDPQFLADLGLPSTVGFCPRNDLAVPHDFERTERENAADRGLDADRSRPGKPDGAARLAAVDRERHQRPAGKERTTRPHRLAPGLIAELLVQPGVRAVQADRHGA